jgi:hypothetical protein
MNQEVERVLRVFTAYAQDDWMKLLPIVAVAINNRDAASTGLSPFFFTHGYHIDPIGLSEEVAASEILRTPPEEAGQRFVSRLKEASDWAQSAIAAAQEEQQTQANRKRQAAPVYKVGDKVWLNLRNVRTERPSKKLDWLHAKYTIVAVPSSHAVKLDVPSGIHPVFHVELVRPAATDPLPSQISDDQQPPAIQIDGEDEYLVEEILRARWKAYGRGRKREVLVKWTGYAEMTWEPLEQMNDCVAMETFVRKYGNPMETDGPQIGLSMTVPVVRLA